MENMASTALSSKDLCLLKQSVYSLDSDVACGSASIESLSNQTGQMAGLTVAALELINSSPRSVDQSNDSPGLRMTTSQDAGPTNEMNIPFNQQVHPTPESVFLREQNSGVLMGGHSHSYVNDSTILAEETQQTLAPLVNVNLNVVSAPGVPSPNSSSVFLTPNQSQLSSPVLTQMNIPERQDSSSDTFQTYDDDYQPHPKIFKSEQQTDAHAHAHDLPQTHIPTPKTNPERGRKRKISKPQNPRADDDKEKNDLLADLKTTKEMLNRPPPHVLPPCKVCGVQATGFHYGVNTCEACKGFFRRSIIRKQPYVCANNQVKCTISPGKRNTCPACRYKKCSEAGMSVEGIKIGRYTYAKRTQDILELQTVPSPPPDTEGDTSDNSDVPLGSMTENELNEFIHAIVEANESKYPESLKNLDFIEKIQNQVKDQYGRGEGPSVTKVPMEQFLNVLASTGVQLDDRFQVLQQWLGLLNEGLKYVITFAKDLPGFRDLSMADQMALIKHSICEIWVIGRHKAFHQDYDLFTTRTGLTLDVVKALGEDLGHCALTVSRRLRSLDLTIEETIVLKAMVIFFTDRCELEEPDRVNALQDKLLESLLYLFSQRGVNNSRTLGKLSSILTEFRHMTEYYQNYTKKLRIISSSTGVVDVPPLFLEVITFT